jgi:hypothetical protein
LGDLISLVAGHAVVLKKLKMWKVYDIRMPNIFFFLSEKLKWDSSSGEQCHKQIHFDLLTIINFFNLSICKQIYRI